MAKLVDALASGASPVKRVEVRVFFWAPVPIILKFSFKNFLDSGYFYATMRLL